ncbi:MAG: LptF/LptG family permease [Ghiorsea sp.]
MTVLFRWIFVSSLLRIVAITIAVVAIFMIAESFDKARHLGQGLSFALLAEYLVLKIPLMISDFMPVIVLIGVAIYMTEISHHHELVAIRAAGIAIPVLLKPLLVAAACAGLFMFAIGEWVEPLTNERRAIIEKVNIERMQPAKHGVQWLRDEGSLLRLTPLQDNYFSLMMLRVGEQGEWVERIDAGKARYEEGKQAWYLEHVFVSQPDQIKDMLIEEVASMTIPTHLSPSTVVAPKPRDMQWFELYAFKKTLADAGLDSDTYEFQLHRKLAAPISCIIMVILAFSLCGNMGSRISANSKGLVIAISLGLIFYVFNNTIAVLVGSGKLPVVYAAWWPNILFLGVAGYLLLEKEGH